VTGLPGPTLLAKSVHWLEKAKVKKENLENQSTNCRLSMMVMMIPVIAI
jgi:hypothetical protein